ncbi:MAG: DEAD/DEAH box helicase [Cyclobacteriaceae bacterium]|nr:DEAD/DEAH box helicase [Cyclobacteriaceae bacterium]
MTQEQKDFSDLPLNKQLLNALIENGFSKPTPIQSKAIPLVSAGHDLLGIAQTGTGKTAAFVLPLLMKVKYAQGNDPRALILAPTRELAIQIESHAQKLAIYTDLRIASIYGGSGTKLQKEKFEKGVDIIIATPGRFMDFYREQIFITKHIKTLVLDEADRMLTMGFGGQIKKIMEIIPSKRQNLLFSATFPPEVEELSHDFLEFPERVEIAPQATPSAMIEQRTYELPNRRTKINFLQYILEKEEEFSRVLIFCRTKKNASDVHHFIDRKITKASAVIHGNKDQNTRINAVNRFQNGEVQVLVATDVVARGIDIRGVSHVINYDVPHLNEDYVHRIGRTGRADTEGVAITLVMPQEWEKIEEIESVIKQKIPRLDLPSEVNIAPTEKEEAQEIARILDYQKQKRDPSYKGAFHARKEKSGSVPKERKHASKNKSKGRNKRGK